MTTEIARFMRQLESVWDDHVLAVVQRRDARAAMAGLTSGASVRHLPTGAGATGAAAVERFYAEEFCPALPAGLTRARRSRTVDRFRLAEEVTVSFTHDRELPWLLPGIPPTHRTAEVLAITVVDFRRGRIDAVRTLWDHATLTARLGLPGLGVPVGP